MKFGVNTFLWGATFGKANLDLLPPIKEHGFEGVQVPLFQPSEFDAADIRRGAEANGLECSVCAIFTSPLSLISEDAAVRSRTRQHVVDCIRAAAEAGSKTLLGPIYAPVCYLPGRRRSADEWNRAVESYQSFTDTLVSHNMTLGIEPLNRFETHFLNTGADAAALCEAVGHPNVGILYDTFHGNIEEKKLGDGLRAVGKHLLHVHACENDRGTPGSGHVEWTGMFQALGDIEYDGWLTIESFAPRAGGFSAAAFIWRDIEKTPESIAFDGIQFLKSVSR
jgi:D-psicose/D-tagatose/L-ribulose 3-epimerase